MFTRLARVLLFAAVSAGVSGHPACAQSSHDSSSIAIAPGVPAEASWFFQAAVEHHAQAYQTLALARGLHRRGGAVDAATVQRLPPDAVVLLYDYIPSWNKKAQYGAGDWAWYGSKLYSVRTRVQPVPGIAPPDAPDIWSPFHTSDSLTPGLRAWLISGSGVEAYAVLPFVPGQLEDGLRDFHRALNGGNLDRIARLRGAGPRGGEAGGRIAFAAALTELQTLLIPAQFWPVLHRFHQLVVVPVLGIAEVPFSLLTSPDGQKLVQTTSLWIARSLQELMDPDSYSAFPWAQSGDWNDAPSAFTFDHPLVVGNPLFKSDPQWYFPSLEGAEAEAKAVSTIMNTQPLLREQAVKTRVLSRAGDADVLFLATHSVTVADDPLSSFLALAAAPAAEGRWTAREIQGLDLHRTDLAVLSACQTGLGGALDAGVIGLGRAFSIAGVRWVVMSLWNVDDAATNDLMQAFVSEMKSCKTRRACLPAPALRAAMVKTMAVRPDPQLWGAFVVLGLPDGSRISGWENLETIGTLGK